MILLPAIDLLHGRVVQLVGGQRDTEQVSLPDPLQVFQEWVRQGADWVHVVDLDNAFGQGNNEAVLLEALRSRRARVQVGGGIRTEEQVKRFLDAGAERVIVGTKALRDPLWLKTMAHRYPDRLLLAVDAREGRVVAHGWMKDTGRDVKEVARSVADLPLAGLLYTAVHVEGRLQGMDREGIERLRDAVQLPLIASGGITTLDDVRFLKRAGVAGAVLGLALYKGLLPFPQAKQAVEEA